MHWKGRCIYNTVIVTLGMGKLKPSLSTRDACMCRTPVCVCFRLFYRVVLTLSASAMGEFHLKLMYLKNHVFS